MVLSPLDEALITVRSVEGSADDVVNAAEDEYYELFLNTELYIPTWDIPEEEKAGTFEEDVTIQPVIIEDESEEENKTYIMIFDSKERLSEWADGREVGIAGLTGFDVINILGSFNHLVLNPLSDAGKEFSPEEIEWLKSSVIN